VNGPTEIRLSFGRSLPRDRTHLVAILNLTPDSFSGDGVMEVDEVLSRAAAALEQGADMLDLGAESTRPGAEPVSAEEEGRRLLPVVKALRERFPATPLSIDTYKPEVYAAAAALGADVLNLVHPLRDVHLDAALASGGAIIISQPFVIAADANGAVDEVMEYLKRAAQRAVARGLHASRVILDPGIGFGKTPEQSVALLGALERLRALGYPTMLAASRKSVLGHLTGRPPAERVHATSATTALAAMNLIDFVRVHDVAAACDVARVCDAVARRDQRGMGHPCKTSTLLTL
jgi:dihydropteroate synthase